MDNQVFINLLNAINTEYIVEGVMSFVGRQSTRAEVTDAVEDSLLNQVIHARIAWNGSYSGFTSYEDALQDVVNQICDEIGID